MALDVYIKLDVYRVLRSLLFTIMERQNDGYKQGFIAALSAVALAFGIALMEKPAPPKDGIVLFVPQLEHKEVWVADEL